MLSRGVTAIFVLMSLTSAGCIGQSPRREGQSLLKKPQLPSDSVVLEVFAVHLRRDDQELLRSIWQEADEQSLPNDVRRRLTENGFRAGVVSGHLPLAVQRILELHSQPTPQQNPDAQQMNVVKFDGRPTIRIQQIQLLARRRGEIATSHVYESATPLYSDEGKLHGETYAQCQGVLAIKTVPENDGRVRLEVVPELHYGEAQRRFTSNEGVLNLETGRPRKNFTQLTHEIPLQPGDLFVIGGCHDKAGSLGDYFFTAESGDRPHAKMLFVRLAHTQNDGLFAPAAERADESASDEMREEPSDDSAAR